MNTYDIRYGLIFLETVRLRYGVYMKRRIVSRQKNFVELKSNDAGTTAGERGLITRESLDLNAVA